MAQQRPLEQYGTGVPWIGLVVLLVNLVNQYEERSSIKDRRMALLSFPAAASALLFPIFFYFGEEK